MYTRSASETLYEGEIGSIYFNVMVFLGIDPGTRTGLAKWDGSDLKIWPAKDFWSAFDIFHELRVDYGDDLVTVIEKPDLNRPLFNKRITGRKRDRYAMNVGSVKRDGQLWVAYMEHRGFPYKAVRPSTSKWDADTLRRITGYRGRTSEHGRDAAKLVFGR